MFIFIYLVLLLLLKFFYWKISKSFSNLLKKNQAFSHKLLLKFRQFLPSYFQDRAVSSKLPPRFTHFLEDLAKSPIFQDFPRYLQELLSSKILEMKPDRFLQITFGSSTGVVMKLSDFFSNIKKMIFFTFSSTFMFKL